MDDEEWEYELVYLSSPLSAREYSEMSVRACVSLNVVGLSTRAELEDFVKTLGFQWVLSLCCRMENSWITGVVMSRAE